MSLWNSFLDNIAKPVGGAIGNVGEYLAGTFTGNFDSPSRTLKNIIIPNDFQDGAKKALSVVGLEDEAQKIVKESLKYSDKAIAKTGDIVLKTAVKVHDEVISPYITRPLATGALLTDFDSPLYSKGEFEQGFQLSDITEAYKRSEEVSLGQALTKSDLSAIKPIADIVFDKGGIDLDEVDLWNDDDIQRAFVDNTVGKYFTGAIDFTIGNIAVGGVFGTAAKTGMLGARKVGLTTRAKNLTTVEKNIDDGILFAQSAGVSGIQTTIGNDIAKLSQTTDINEVSGILSKYTNNENLFGPIQRSTDPNTVKDLILADKGYLPALDRLSKNAPADLYEIADMNSIMRARRIEEGRPLEFSDEAWVRMNAAFDDAINRTPEYKFIKDSLLDPATGTPYKFAKDYVPMEPVLGKGPFIKTRERFQNLKAASVTRDFTRLGGIEERILGGSLNGPITKFVRFVGTEKPLGFVTYSGSRPLDGLKEIDAFFDDIELFRNGANQINITPKTKISAGEYRTQMKSKFANAKSNIERNNVLDELEDQIGLVLAYTKGFTDTRTIKTFTQEIKNQVFGATNSIAQKGYAMDAQGHRVITDAQTQRQLIESRRMAPWGLIERELNNAIGKRKFETATYQANDALKFVYETFNKYWSIDVLARPSYIPKNSLFEPILSSTLAHGNKFITDNIPNMAKNSIRNNKDRIMGRANKILNAKQFKAVDQAVTDLSKQLDEAVNTLDTLTAEAALYLEPEKFAIKLSPKTIRDNKALIMKDLKAASKLVDDIELELRDAVRPFGEQAATPTIASLERRVQFLESISGTTTKKTKLFPNIREYKDGGRGGLPETRSVVGFVDSKYLEKMPGNPVDAELVNSYREIYRSGKLEEPLMVIYDNETGFAYLGEGNHRLQAALAENVPYLPVRIVRGSAKEMENRIAKNQPVLQVKNNKTLPFTTGGPKGPVEYMPTDVHPSFVFDKKFLVKEDAYSQTSSTAKYGAQIANAKSAITKAKGSIHTLAPEAKEILAANKEIANQYKAIDDILNGLGKARKDQADVYLKNAAYKKRYYGKPVRYQEIEGRWVPAESLFAENKFGAAFTEEFGNSRTVAANYLGQVGLGVRSNLTLRRGPSTVTFVNDPIYFDELAYFVNRSLRGDKLINKIFAKSNEKELVQWGLSAEGKAYFAQFGDTSPSFIVETVRDRLGLVNRYLPNVEAQALALSKDVNSAELAQILSKDLNRLSPIHPLDFNVHVASEFGYRTLDKIEGALNRGASRIFGLLTRPENPIRWASGDKFFQDALTKKANELTEQGFTFINKDGTFNFEKLDVLRSSARREALEMNEKTFYTIRRQNRALYAARLATAFPTASLNAFYRYGRFSLKNPERIGQFLYNYQAAFRSFGIDQNGNPTDDPMAATHLVVPTTKELGFFGGKGIRLNARSIGFLLNYPSPSIFSSVATAEIYKRKPEMEDLMKGWLGANYDVLFPYGPQTDWKSSLVPRWAKDAWFYLNGPQGNADFLNSWKDVHNYYMTLDDLGIMKYPGDEAVYRDTRKNFAIKANWSFASIFGAPAKVDINPMALYEEAYGLLINKYKLITNNDKLAAELAGAEMTAKLGPNFPIDRVSFKGSSANAFIQPNVESYKRVFEDSTGLAEKLARQNPELVGLLTLDIDPSKEEFNMSVYKILNDPKTRLPDGSPLNDVKLTPKQEEERRQINRGWALYNQLTDTLEAEAVKRDGKSLRSHPELLEARRIVAGDLIRKQSESWWTEYNDPQRGDKSYRYAYALNSIVDNDAWMKKYGNTKLWNDVKEFMAIRNTVVEVYKGMPDRSSQKSNVKKNYIAFIDERMKTWHPKLQELINRNFEEDTMKDATLREGK
jgi:hypothetical protein